jgi:hypothetical protein
LAFFPQPHYAFLNDFQKPLDLWTAAAKRSEAAAFVVVAALPHISEAALSYVLA